MKLVKNLISLIVFTAALAAMQSCVYDKPDTPPEAALSSEQTVIVLNARALNGPEPETNDIRELVKSWRIVMIDENGLIECNRRFSLDNIEAGKAETIVDQFFQITTPGNKKFYLFANEESVADADASMAKTDSFTDLLDSYREGTDTGDDFESVINSYHFKPDYKVENGAIYLPYTSFYTLQMEGGKRYDKDMFLVPVATKIYFNFNNFRQFPVKVKEVGISRIAEDSYLLGNVTGEDRNKYYGSEKLYWVDWLAKVSEESGNYDSFLPNVGFNEQTGWIFDYLVPSGAEHSDKTFVDNLNQFTVAEATSVAGGSPVPSTVSLNYCYLPESKYIPEGSSTQVYYLTLELEDTNPSVGAIELDPIPLSNVKALFRNTRVIINVNFNEGTDDIYVEIRSWFETDDFYGTVIQ